MLVSPFTPLFFGDHRADGRPSEYMQVFSTADSILLELFDIPQDKGGKPIGRFTAMVYSEPGHNIYAPVSLKTWNINTDVVLHFCEIHLPEGIYTVEVDGVGCSRPFEVTADKDILSKTVLFQYSMDSNEHRTDGIFFIEGMQRFFSFRVHGGFKDSGWAFSVDSEQFVTDRADIVQLYALDSVQKTLTIGPCSGVPIWFGEMINRLLCCTYVYIDGKRYARKDTAVPEVTAVYEGVDSYVMTQSLQAINYLDPVLELKHQAILRRVSAGTYRKVNNKLRHI